MPEVRSVLVTGAAGFIGSHTVEALLRDGYRVTGLDSLVHGSLENLSGAASSQSFAFIRGDITDVNCLRESLRNVDAVIHLAAFTSNKESIENPVKFHETNVTGTLTMLRAASELGVKRLVYASSAAVTEEPTNHRTTKTCRCTLNLRTQHPKSLGKPTVEPISLPLIYQPSYCVT